MTGFISIVPESFLVSSAMTSASAGGGPELVAELRRLVGHYNIIGTYEGPNTMHLMRSKYRAPFPV